MMITAIVGLVALLGGGVSVVAHGSLPGDPFYPVKVNINEPVREALAFGASAKARVEARRAQARLSEAGKLALEGRADADLQAELRQRFEFSADASLRRAEAMAQESGTEGSEAAAFLESALVVHEQVLAGLQVDAALQASVRERREHAMRIRSSGEARTRARAQGEDGRSSAQRAIDAATLARERLRSSFDGERASMQADVAARVEARLTAADETLAQARAKIEAQTYGDAYVLGTSALRMVQEASTLLRERHQLEVEVGASPQVEGSVELNLGL